MAAPPIYNPLTRVTTTFYSSIQGDYGNSLYNQGKGTVTMVEENVVPCVHHIPGGMYPGKMIRVQGSTPLGAYRFAINLQCGPNTDPRDDIALHINFRFPECCVVRNHLSSMSWGPEEIAGGLPINRGESFEALILCEPNSIKVALNGIHFCEFIHRLPYQRITHITVDGDVMLTFIGFEGAQSAPPGQFMQPGYAPPAYGAPPPAYGAPGYGPPQGGGYMVQPQQSEYASSYAQPQAQARSGISTGAAAGIGVGALAAGGLAGYALAGGFSGGGGSPPREEVQVASFEIDDFGGDDWME